MNIVTKFKEGEIAYVASFSNTSVKKTCPICFGKCSITLILGDTTHLDVPCSYCSKGYDPPTGYIYEFEFVAEAKPFIITAISINIVNDIPEITYHSSYSSYKENELFSSKDDAMPKALELQRKYEDEQNTRAIHIKKDQNRSYSWNAGYHLREIKKLTKQIEYHKSKATICQQKAKTNDQNP